jgi:hypothetical protein
LNLMIAADIVLNWAQRPKLILFARPEPRQLARLSLGKMKIRMGAPRKNPRSPAGGPHASSCADVLTHTPAGVDGYPMLDQHFLNHPEKGRERIERERLLGLNFMSVVSFHPNNAFSPGMLWAHVMFASCDVVRPETDLNFDHPFPEGSVTRRVCSCHLLHLYYSEFGLTVSIHPTRAYQ